MNWRRFFRREEADDEQREELDFYLDVTTKEYIELGMEPTAARTAARTAWASLARSDLSASGALLPARISSKPSGP